MPISVQNWGNITLVKIFMILQSIDVTNIRVF